MPALRIAVPLAIGTLAALSLLAPFAPVYDPWAWLVWGRELTALELDTGAGPSWKPLTVMIAALLSPAGDAAPGLWLWVARAGWLAAVALAFRLAWRLMFPPRFATAVAERFAPRRVRLARALAGALAATGVVLLFDPFTSWTRQFAGGLSEPLLVALVLGAVDRELSGRRGQALALAGAAALLRPEAWPLLGAYAIWVWPRDLRLRPWLVLGAIALPALWLIPDLAGSGDPLTGALRAREATGAPIPEALESLGRSLQLPLAGVLVASGVAIVSARALGEMPILVLGTGALAWTLIVALLAGAGFAGLPRFAAPAAAVVCILGAIGVVRLAASIDGMRLTDRRRIPATALAAVLVGAIGVQGAIRTAQIPDEVASASGFAAGVSDLHGLAESAGVRRLTACPPLTTTDFLTETAVAWRLELPLRAVDLRVRSAPEDGIALVSAAGAEKAATAIAGSGRPIARHRSWRVYEISCPATSAASGRAIAGVAGASR